MLSVGNLTFSAWEEGGEEQVVDNPDDAAALLQVTLTLTLTLAPAPAPALAVALTSPSPSP